MDLEACGQSSGGELDFFFGKSANYSVMHSGGNKIDVMRFDNWASMQDSRTKKSGTIPEPAAKANESETLSYVLLSDPEPWILFSNG